MSYMGTNELPSALATDGWLALLTGIILWAFLIAITQFLFLFPQSIYSGIQIGLSDVNKMPIKLRLKELVQFFLVYVGAP